MKFIHLSDLHIGKVVNGFSMIDEQRYILNEILEIADKEKPNAVLIAGDVYDKAVPPTEAVQLFDDFLVKLSFKKIPVFIISGNHDSAQRIAFARKLMETSSIYISPVYRGDVKPIVLNDEYGEVCVYMLPFIKPLNIRVLFPNEEFKTYNDAIKKAVDIMNVDKNKRNILITHQFVTGAERCESEEISVGGSDNIDTAVFDDFDYVALGHLHSPQKVKKDTIRYCGTPLKYSFSECMHKKSVTVVELKNKGEDLEIRTIPLVPQHDMREIKGKYMELTDRNNYKGTDTLDYLHITLTDEDDIPDAVSKLRIIYPNIMKLSYDNARTKQKNNIVATTEIEEKLPIDLFMDFYKQQNNQEMDTEQINFVREIIDNVWEGQE